MNIWLIDLAELSLRTAQVETRADAQRVLPIWHRYHELSACELRAVYARFPAQPGSR